MPRASVIVEPGRLEVRDMPEPVLEPGDALDDVRHARVIKAAVSPNGPGIEHTRGQP